MFDFALPQTRRLSSQDQRAFERDEMRRLRDDLAGRMMLNAAGRAELARLNALLGD